MRSIVIEKTGIFCSTRPPRTRRRRIRSRGGREVLLRLAGTDIHLLQGEFKGAGISPDSPGTNFQERCGKFGAKVTNAKPGDRVAIEPFIFCQTCLYCKRRARPTIA